MSSITGGARIEGIVTERPSGDFEQVPNPPRDLVSEVWYVAEQLAWTVDYVDTDHGDGRVSVTFRPRPKRLTE